MRFDGKARLVKITVKEFARHGNRVYSVEAISAGEVSPVPEMVDADRANGSRLLTGPTGLIDSLAQRVRDFNPDKISKVVDANGEPLVVYHGTGMDIQAFDTQGDRVRAGKLGKGVYLTPPKQKANLFAKLRAQDGAPVVMPLYSVVANPLVIHGENNRPVSDMDQDAMRAAGYDGVILTADDGSAISEIVAFRPEQIKSAIGNNGQFSPRQPRHPLQHRRQSAGRHAASLSRQRMAARQGQGCGRSFSGEHRQGHLRVAGQVHRPAAAARPHQGDRRHDHRLKDAYLGEELYHKRLAYRTEEFEKYELLPLAVDLKSKGITTEEYGWFEEHGRSNLWRPSAGNRLLLSPSAPPRNGYKGEGSEISVDDD
ncbi:MAG TPA: hypothetical protein PL117_13590 [Accumulibacter sp.]|uniref:ADP-ribosyltransferase-containing protein n=1 Tax=Accumulibacter sp. TaxID=2053492 RepID=UPI002BAB1812|nr:hypothetical protein [Accumulibacter sp.]HRF73798.1 hypothetical protein [Accumulibacter sp.]